MPPLPADSIHARACKLKCEKILTRPYNALDLVTKINYNDAKEVSYRYNKTGDLVSMTDWLGTTTFELDLLHQMTAATDHAGKRVEYTYDGVGNQTSIKMIWRSFATLKKLPLLLY